MQEKQQIKTWYAILCGDEEFGKRKIRVMSFTQLGAMKLAKQYCIGNECITQLLDASMKVVWNK